MTKLRKMDIKLLWNFKLNKLRIYSYSKSPNKFSSGLFVLCMLLAVLGFELRASHCSTTLTTPSPLCRLLTLKCVEGTTLGLQG
jgi:hypothetical protein